MIRVHSNDPGVKNNAVAVLDFRVSSKQKIQYRVVDCHMQQPAHIVTQLKGDVQSLVARYMRRQRVLAKKCDLYVAERYMVRGRFGGNQVELVSFMLALTCAAYGKRPAMLLSAATWKNAANKVFDLEQVYSMGKAAHKLPPHLIDAVLIGFYGAAKTLGVTPFATLKTKTSQRKLLKKIANKCPTNVQ